MSTYEMETKVVRDNYRIEVIPEERYYRSDRKTPHEYSTLELRELKESIDRHVDGAKEVTAHWDTTVVCVHCNTPVANAMTDDGPGCCDEAVELYDAWKAAQA